MQHSQSAFTLDDRKVVIGLLRFADILIVAVAGTAAYWVRHRTMTLPDQYMVAIAVAVLLTANYLQFARLYEFNRLQQFTLQVGTLVAS